MTCALVLVWPRPVQAQIAPSDLTGIVVRVGTAQRDLAAEAARAAPLTFRGGELAPLRPEVRADDQGARLDAAETAWSDADFPSCLSTLDGMSLDDLLASGAREPAGRLASLTSRCAFGMGEVPRARAVLRRALGAELSGLDAGAADYRRVLDEVRAELAREAPVELELRASAARIRVVVDGRPSRCTGAPCALSLAPTEHVVVVEALGFEPAVHVVDAASSRTIEAALARADAATTRGAIARALAEGQRPDDPEIVEALALVFEDPIVVVSWTEAGEDRAYVFDRTVSRVVSRAAVRGEGGAGLSVRNAVGEWWGVARPRPIEEDPVLWTVVGVSVVAVGVGAALLIAFVPVGEPDVVVRF